MSETHDEPHFLEPIAGVFTDLGAAKKEPPKWLIENLLPVGLTVLGAPPKAGKSTLEMAIAALVAGLDCRALPLDLSKVCISGPVMGFSAEATAGELRHMLEEGMGVKVPDNESILIADDPFAWRLDDEDGSERLGHWLDERRPRLVFIDPLRDFHSAEENDSGEMVKVMRPLQRWAKATDSAVIIVHHTAKPKEGQQKYDPLSLRGSSAIFGLADCVWMITPAPNKYMRMAAIFKRAAPWERTFRMAAYEFVGQTADEPMTELDENVLRGIAAGIGTLADIAVQLHVSKAQVIDSAKKLFAAGLITKEGRTWIQTTR